MIAFKISFPRLEGINRENSGETSAELRVKMAVKRRQIVAKNILVVPQRSHDAVYLLLALECVWPPGNVVGITTRYELGGSGIEPRRELRNLHTSRLALRSTYPFVH